MRTILLTFSFFLCFILCLSGQSGTQPNGQFKIRKTKTVFHILPTPGTDHYQLISGQVSQNKMVLNLVSTKEVMSQKNRRLASVSNTTEDTMTYQLEVIKYDIKSFTKNDLNNSSLQVQFIAP
ncbi:MAG: hypothetical protein ACK5P5_12985 [Pseudobdellovibrionaceae bacterium]